MGSSQCTGGDRLAVAVRTRSGLFRCVQARTAAERLRGVRMSKVVMDARAVALERAAVPLCWQAIRSALLS